MTAAIVVACRAVARGRARGIGKMWFLPGMFDSFRQWRVSRVVQPAVPLCGHCRGFLCTGVYYPATGPQAAATLRLLNIVPISKGVVTDQPSPQIDCQPRTEVHG